MKLKTLKDLENSNYDTELCKELRKEAIKWIKQDITIGKTNGLIKLKPKYGDLPTGYLLMILRWIKRFNLTEEDLK